MLEREQYTPGPASGAQVRRDGEKWTLILVRELRHSPEKVWQALTDPAHLREWAPFDADGSLGTAGATVKLTTVGAPTPRVSETTVTRADAPDRKSTRLNSSHLAISYAHRNLHCVPTRRSSDLSFSSENCATRRKKSGRRLLTRRICVSGRLSTPMGA